MVITQTQGGMAYEGVVIVSCYNFLPSLTFLETVGAAELAV
jgi:hypothetical protein